MGFAPGLKNLVVTKNYGKTEKQFRKLCEMNGDDISILTSGIRYTYASERDLRTLREYGWNDEDLEKLVRADERADDITRLAAWVREAGEIDHGMVIEDDPYIICALDEDMNYPEKPEVF